MADGRDTNSGNGQREWRQFDAIGPLMKHGFSVIPNVVLRDRTLSGLAKAVYVLLYDYTHREEPSSMETMQADLGVGEKAARQALRELENAGLVVRRRHGQGRPNSYHLTAPGDAQTLPEAGSRTAAGADPTITEDLGEDADVERASTSGGGTVRTRKRSVAFDALAEATGANPSASGGQIAKALKAIREAEAAAIAEKVAETLAAQPEMESVPPERIDAYLAEKIRARARRYAECRPDWTLTPTALASHWLRIPTWEPRADAHRDEAEQAWQHVLNRPHAELDGRERAALKKIGGSFTVRSSTHLPTVRRSFIAAWDDTAAA